MFLVVCAGARGWLGLITIGAGTGKGTAGVAPSERGPFCSGRAGRAAGCCSRSTPRAPGNGRGQQIWRHRGFDDSAKRHDAHVRRIRMDSGSHQAIVSAGLDRLDAAALQFGGAQGKQIHQRRGVERPLRRRERALDADGQLRRRRRATRSAAAVLKASFAH